MGSQDLNGKDPTGLSIAKYKGPITWKPWTGGSWSNLWNVEHLKRYYQ